MFGFPIFRFWAYPMKVIQETLVHTKFDIYVFIMNYFWQFLIFSREHISPKSHNSTCYVYFQRIHPKFIMSFNIIFCLHKKFFVCILWMLFLPKEIFRHFHNCFFINSPFQHFCHFFHKLFFSWKKVFFNNLVLLNIFFHILFPYEEFFFIFFYVLKLKKNHFFILNSYIFFIIFKIKKIP